MPIKKLADNQKIAELYNNAAHSLIKENNKIISAGIPDLSSKAKMIESAKELHCNGFAALSLASSYNGSFLDEAYFPLFELCQELEMPIHVHAQTNKPNWLRSIKRSFTYACTRIYIRYFNVPWLFVNERRLWPI